METALHQLVVRDEKALDQQEIALGVFLGTALARHGAEQTIVRWIRTTLEGRPATEALGDVTRNVAVSRGCPQGGVLSLLLWCLVVNNLLARLNEGNVYTQGYAGDICLLAVGKFPNTVSGLIQWALHTVEEWCSGMSVS